MFIEQVLGVTHYAEPPYLYENWICAINLFEPLL